MKKPKKVLACRNGHDWIRYVLTDSPASHTQRDGIDNHGRPYRDVPMLPMEAFAYAKTIGSDFAKRVVEAICRDCGAKVMNNLNSGNERHVQTVTSIKDYESSFVEINLGDCTQDSAQAILWIRSDIKIGYGVEAVCTVRPRAPFRPERLAILAACAGAFDLVDLQVTFCSVFADVESGTDIPAVRYATAYELRPSPANDTWISGPHRAIVSDETHFGLPIDSRVCLPCHAVSITVRHHQDAPPSALEAVILGTVLSDEEGYRTYLAEQQSLEQAWQRRAHR